MTVGYPFFVFVPRGGENQLLREKNFWSEQFEAFHWSTNPLQFKCITNQQAILAGRIGMLRGIVMFANMECRNLNQKYTD
ncbi:hypothetical protein FGF1_43250 [Flavobacteriaceae bacterium GF1]